MTNQSEEKEQAKLNGYLSELEQTLGKVSVQDRCAILMELNTHIQESLKNNDRSIDEILMALGDPPQVANRYLITKGVPLVPLKKKWSFLRSILLTCLGLFTISTVGLIILVKSFFPLFEINEKEGTFRMLGGMVVFQEER